MIFHITGPKKCGKSLIANSLRDTHISAGKGALLIDDTQKGEPRYLIEKIMDGDFFPNEDNKPGQGKAIPTPVKDLKFKEDPLIIIVGDHGRKVLEDIEKLAPGFEKKFGPITTMPLSQ